MKINSVRMVSINVVNEDITTVNNVMMLFFIMHWAYSVLNDFIPSR